MRRRHSQNIVRRGTYHLGGASSCSYTLNWSYDRFFTAAGAAGVVPLCFSIRRPVFSSRSSKLKMNILIEDEETPEQRAEGARTISPRGVRSQKVDIKGGAEQGSNS